MAGKVARRTGCSCVRRRRARPRARRASAITSQEFATYQFPINVKIDTQLVGGPSAGLAFTLAIIDDLTPGSLTGGKQVAVTGHHRARRHASARWAASSRRRSPRARTGCSS